MTKREPDDASTIVRGGVDAATLRVATYKVVVLDGLDCGREFELGGSQADRALVGKGEACHVRLTDPQVSRRHAAFDASNQELHLRDLGSTNGTFVNGVRVVDAVLSGGETLRLGDTVLRLDLASRDAAINVPIATNFGRTVGASVAMRMLYPRCQKLASSNVATLIEGETGTGKEVLAESLHEQGQRANGPFVVFDCTAVSPSLIESELFGHERGAFTGAEMTRKGVFEQAHGGTLLIDEIGDLPPALQPKLLRVLERGEVRRIGGNNWIKADVRVISATRRDLDREVQEGRFRDDLYFRIAIARIELPPLRQRLGDVALLTRHFSKVFGKNPDALPYDVIERFERNEWPGNVRELANAIGRFFALGADDSIPNVVPPPARDRDPIAEVLSLDLPITLARQKLVAEFERRYIKSVLEKHGGNIARAAEASGIARRYFNILLVKQRDAP